MLLQLIASDSTENEKKHNKYEKHKGYVQYERDEVLQQENL